jgi:type III restriction enzyme
MKMATGSGKTTVMAMLIAWQTLNAIRSRRSGQFSKGFLIVTPGITIKDRLRVLQPDDPDNYYRERQIVPSDSLAEMGKAKIVITNYHAFKLRETMEISKVGRSLLQGRGEAPETLESEGEMLRRACGELMALKNVVVINDEAHHCYRHKAIVEEEQATSEEKEEAKKNDEAARLWISGLEALNRKLGLRGVYDLSATPFFLRGSGYAEGHAVPLDGERLLADGCDRERHCEAAARARRRQSAWRRDTDVSRPMEAYRQEDAEEGPLQDR